MSFPHQDIGVLSQACSSMPSCRHDPPIVTAICSSPGRSTTSRAAVAKSAFPYGPDADSKQLSSCRVPTSDPNTSQAQRNVPLAAHAALRVPTRPETCAECGTEWAAHLDQAARLFSTHKRVPYAENCHLLHLWWSEVTKWVCDRPVFLDSHIDRDLFLAESVLHHLPTSGPPDFAFPHPGSKDDVTLETAAKGIGPAESIHVPQDLWHTWADPLFEAAGQHAPS